VLRTFLALDLDETFLRDTLAFMDELRGEQLPRVRWVAPANVHVTLRFLGDTDEALVPRLSELVTALGEASHEPLEVRSTSLLTFPNPRRAHVLALHLDDRGATSELAVAAERAVTALGFPSEERSFRPHLTLARIRKPADLRRLLAARSTPRPGGRLHALTLYKSELGKEAPVHTPLARYELGREPSIG
jgi:2'-5' RNA ligase